MRASGEMKESNIKLFQLFKILNRHSVTRYPNLSTNVNYKNSVHLLIWFIVEMHSSSH